MEYDSCIIERLGFESFEEFEQALEGEDGEYYEAQFEIELARDQIKSYKQSTKTHKSINLFGLLIIGITSAAAYGNFILGNTWLMIVNILFTAFNVIANFRLNKSKKKLDRDINKTIRYIITRYGHLLDEEFKKEIDGFIDQN